MRLKDPNPSDSFWIPGTERGLAEEEHWNHVMSLIGAQRVDCLVSQPSFRNADYVWNDAKLVIELKNLNVELADQPGFADKIVNVVEKSKTQEDADKAAGSIIRSYLKDIICTANKQIKETKRELGFSLYSGIVLIVNSGFATLTFPAASKCFKSIINSRTQFSSVSGLIYVEDIDKPHSEQGMRDYMGLFGTHKMTVSTEASMIMITKAWQMYLANPWLRGSEASSYAIGFEGSRDGSSHWRPSDVRAFLIKRASISGRFS